MKGIAHVFGVLGVIAIAVLVLAWVERGSSDEPQTEVACVYYGGTCVPPGAFSGISVRLTP